MKSNHTYGNIQLPSKDKMKVVMAIIVLVALAAVLSITPPLTQTTIALGFVAFWLAGAAATVVFLVYSSRNKSLPT